MKVGQGGTAFLRWSRRLGFAALLVLPVWHVVAQETTAPADPVPTETAPAEPAPQVDGTGALVPNTGGRGVQGPGLFQETPDPEPTGPNYDEWTLMAASADALLDADQSVGRELDEMRARLVDWREAFLGAQNANSTRIAVIRSQIAALGPAPVEGAVESEEIASRRGELTDQLVRLQAPGIKAEEAYEQANGLIQQLDRLRRDRQAEELLRLWPSPLNPANWSAGVAAVSQIAVTLYGETREMLASDVAQAARVQNLPLLALLFAFSGAILWRGRRWIDMVLRWLPLPKDARAARISMFLASLGEIIIPVSACVALTIALRLTGLVGQVGFSLSGLVSVAGLLIFTALWLAGQLFSMQSPLHDLIDNSPERWAEGKFLLFACGLFLALARLRGVLVNQLDLNDKAASVTLFPVVLFGGFVLIRIGRLIAHMLKASAQDEDDNAAIRGVLRLLGKIITAIGVVAPLLAAVGYNSAATALLVPAAVTLGLFGVLALIQQVLADLWGLVTRAQPGQRDALIPVLLGFGLALAAIPIVALIWGADIADLTELWTRFKSGFMLGETRISPTNFLMFAVVFVIGVTVTRVLQGVLKGQILPRIGMDQGGRNAIAVGTGYAGIFLSALVAINAAGIDLSGLAIVAGALSVGIGFGLQAIVSNFVSGIILLIERPVSEGDWIEVGGVQGIVKSISVRSTRIQTFDRTDVIVPNQDLITSQVTNWTRFSLSGRLVVPVGVAFGSDTRKVEQILLSIAMAQPEALLTPPPQVAFVGFGADAMNFEIRAILRDVNLSAVVRTEINHEIVQRFAEEGIEIPFAQSEITLRNAAEIAELLRALPKSTVPPTRGSRISPANGKPTVLTDIPPPGPAPEGRDDAGFDSDVGPDGDKGNPA